MTVGAKEADLVAVGRLMRSHGIFGDILCKPLTNDLTRHSLLKNVFLESPNGKIKEAVILHSEMFGSLWKFRFENYATPETVRLITNSYLLIPQNERLPVPEGQFYFSDFEGFEAVSRDGKIIGKVVSAEEMPSVNVFNLQICNCENKNENSGECLSHNSQKKEIKEIVVPWIDECILNIDIKDKKITVDEEYLETLL